MSESFLSRGVSLQHLLLRRAGSRLISALLPCRVVDGARGLSRAEGLLRQGYGLIVIMNHFSFRDAPQALALLCSSPLMCRRPILAPVALHQYRRYAAPVRACAALFAVSLAPVVTRQTEAQHVRGADLRQGLKAYVAQATSVLQSGGMVLLAPQGSRQSHLGSPPGRPVAQLLRRLPEEQRARVALLFMGLSIPGQASYMPQQVGALNLGQLYEARIGATVTVPAALREASDLRALDAWVFERLRPLVPAAYSGAEGIAPVPGLSRILSNSEPLMPRE